MNFKKLVASVAMTASAALIATGAQAEAKVDPKLPAYSKVGGVSGNISSVGSDTLANLMTFWAEEFKKQYPNVAVQIQAAGSSTAPPALTEGTSNLGPMSRKMKDKEIEAFEKKFGYKPTAIPVAIDALAVFVNKDNPIKGLDIEQVDAIFSSTRTCGGANDITKWGQVGLTGEWANRDIQLYGRNSVSGTYGYFKDEALCKGDFKSSVNEQPGSASVVQSVATSLNGVGYSGIGYKTSSVRALPLAKKGTKYVEASPEAALDGSYPLSRALYVYVNKAPGKELSPLEREFVKLIMSKEGQEIVVKDGYIPLPSSLVAKTLGKLGIKSEIAAK
ncbi:PstS family phosphate ABC transporter substrate-binding protein [Ketobacter sp.]|uniref:PstS family phosphate ABC transporter substrate-binding protein n=1 Tax=Ketobacter sp. TaxID=2083498 RepID=UPI000F14F2A7|nr:phosphate ABC transporter substrate-binding protein PstS family protein [Ketobacter sp.]RLT95051.1 MAG: phosphate ABC transporter substrate-binding protein PstS family protein [Ketobacter sp.]